MSETIECIELPLRSYGGDGGTLPGGGIQEITSVDGSIVVTEPFGPITDLSSSVFWEDVGTGAGGGGAGSGIQFDTDPQSGDWLMVETTSTFDGPSNDGMRFYSSGDIEIQNTTTDNTGNIFIAGDSGVGIEGAGDEGVVIGAHGAGNVLIRVISGTGNHLVLRVLSSAGHQLQIIGLPTSNPGGPGGNYVWRDASGFLRIG